MQVIEAQCASILEPHDHLHISHDRAFARVLRGPLAGVLAAGTVAASMAGSD